MGKYNWQIEVANYDWKNKKILVAGGTGFIGKRCVEFLNDFGAEVYVLTRKKKENIGNITYWQADLEDSESLKQYAKKLKFDAGIYLAARIPMTDGKTESFVEAKHSTFDAFVNYCDSFLEDTDQLVYASSIAVVGCCTLPEYDELVQPNNLTPYGLAKYCGELYAEGVCREKGKKLTMLRFAHVYGPGEPLIKIIPKLCDILEQGKEFTLFTTGDEKRRYVYVDDTVQSVIRSLVSERGGTYNIAGSEIVSMNELLEIIQSVWGKPLNLIRLDKQTGVDDIPGIDSAVSKLGYKPEVSLEKGLTVIRKSVSG